MPLVGLVMTCCRPQSASRSSSSWCRLGVLHSGFIDPVCQSMPGKLRSPRTQMLAFVANADLTTDSLKSLKLLIERCTSVCIIPSLPSSNSDRCLQSCYPGFDTGHDHIASLHQMTTLYGSNKTKPKLRYEILELALQMAPHY